MKHFYLSQYIKLVVISIILSACSHFDTSLDADADFTDTNDNFDYTIGPGDRLNIFVWRNPDISTTVPVRPDGRISSPLVDDITASGKTPSELANDIEDVLSKYVKDPLVTVTVLEFVGGFDQQVRVIGEATTPQALQYRRNMTILDVMIAVGGLTEFAAGNKAKIIRYSDEQKIQINVRLDDLLRGGDINANKNVRPGDIIVIPESFF